MTLPLLRRSSRRPRPVLVDVTNRWKVTYRADGTSVHRREVLAAYPDGTRRVGYLSDDHPALVAWLERAAA